MRSRALGYLLLAAWGSWLSAGMGLAGRWGATSVFLPDPVLVLVVLIAAKLPRREAFPGALILALARIAFSIDPPVAILASYLGAALFLRGMRRGVEIQGPLMRGLLCTAIVWMDAFWLVGVRAQRAVFAGDGGLALGLPGGDTWLRAASYGAPRALTSGLLAMIFGAALLRLPGLRLLERRRGY